MKATQKFTRALMAAAVALSMALVACGGGSDTGDDEFDAAWAEGDKGECVPDAELKNPGEFPSCEQATKK